MYLSYYQLKHKPFQISTDPNFLWLGEKHMEALATLRYGVLDNKGFLLLTGDVGTGKTTLINTLLKTLDDTVLVAAIRDPALDPLDFFQYTAHSFGIDAEITTKGIFLIQFEKFLNTAHAQGKKVLLIIDEAQRINQKLLEEVRVLSNIEKDECKLLNIFFVGQIEFNDMLLLPVNRPIRQRVTVNYNIEKLSQTETEQYIAHRLAIARQKTLPKPDDGPNKNNTDIFMQERLPSNSQEEGNIIFTNEALHEIFLFSKGYPRLINIICDRSLLTGFVEEAKLVTSEHVRECAQELEIPYFGLDHERDHQSYNEGANNTQATSAQLNETNLETSIAEQGGNTALGDITVPIEKENDPKGHSSSFLKPTGRNNAKNQKNRSTFVNIVILASLVCILILLSLKHFNTALAPAFSKTNETVEVLISLWQSLSGGITESQTNIKPPQKSKIQPTNNKTISRTIPSSLVLPFSPNSTLPPSDSLVSIDQFVASILPQKTFKVCVSSFSNASEDNKTNREEAERRAKAIRIYLMDQGLEPERIENLGINTDFSLTASDDTQEKPATHRVVIEACK